jgi:hypothetical protein
LSRFKILVALAFLLALVVVALATHNVSAGDPTGGGHGIISIAL